jgi:hypothetical protein
METATKKAKCPACGKNVKIVGTYKNGTPVLAIHERKGFRGQSCDSFVSRKDLGLPELGKMNPIFEGHS